MACPDRLSQWTQEVSTTFSHLSKPQIWGLVRLSRRHRALRSSRDHANQCSARVSVAGTGTNGVSAFTRVVVFMPGRRAGKSGVTWRCPRVLRPCLDGCYACGEVKSVNYRW